MLDKPDHPPIPDGYGVCVAFHSLLEMVSSVRILIIGDAEDKGQGQKKSEGQREKKAEKKGGAGDSGEGTKGEQNIDF
jgi:hypothetical protein